MDVVTLLDVTHKLQEICALLQQLKVRRDKAGHMKCHQILYLG